MMVIRLRRQTRDQNGRWLYVSGWDNDANTATLTGDQGAAMTFKSFEEAERLKAMSPALFDYSPVFGSSA